MKKLEENFKQVLSTHFSAYNTTINTTEENDKLYLLKLSNGLNVNEIIIYTKSIEKVIKDNFTIFERTILTKKIQDTAVIVICSTLYNLVKSRHHLELLAFNSGTTFLSEKEYAENEDRLIGIMEEFIKDILPYNDRIKYIIQPSIKVNLNSNLPLIFSDILMVKFRALIGLK